jgi:O-Antigen ligase
MRAILERPSVEGDRAASPDAFSSSLWAGPAVLGGLALLVTASVFAGDGSRNGVVFPIGVGAVGLAVAAWVAVAAGAIAAPRVGRAGAACHVLFGLLVLWEALSVTWSIAPDRSWAYANRNLTYLALLVVGVFAGALLRRAPTLLAAGLTVLVAAVLAWAFAGKIAPGLAEDGGRIARLRAPIGYWNALALVIVLGVPLALWLATDRRPRHVIRAGSVALLAALIVGLVLTYSRGGILIAVVALAVWLAVSSRRLEGLLALAIAAPFAAGVLAFTFGLDGVVADGQDYAARVDDGRAFGLALGLALAAAFAAGFAASKLEARRPISERAREQTTRVLRLAVAGLAVAAVAILAVMAGAVGRWIESQADEFANPPTELVTQESSRLLSFSSNNRWVWWNEAWDAFKERPALGLGASSFPTTHRILREDELTVTTPHDVPLQLLAETGVVGALLGCGAAAAALVSLACALRRLKGSERAAAAALTAGIVAFVLHALVDYDWEFIALVAPVLVSSGALFSSGRPPGSPQRSPALVPIAFAVLAAVALSLALPWLSARQVDAAYSQLGRARATQALEAADRARSLNPLALDPLLARAAAQQALGDVDGARTTLIRAVELQPLDSNAWYELGAFELEVANRPVAARLYLERAAELDRHGPAPALLAQIPPQ